MSQTQSVAGEPEDVPSLRAWLALGILLGLTIVSFIDRGVISLMVDPIKQDLGISDVQIGLLQGLAFAIFYAAFSVPMGWMGDRFSKHWVIYLGVTAWSIATACCGLARTFVQLLLARFMVGVGEATLAPCGYAMIAELFPRRRLALALSILAAGSSIGSALAIAIGGFVVEWANETGGIAGLRPWQTVFVVVGLPGILLAPLVFLIPRGERKTITAGSQALSDTPGYWQWFRANLGYILPLSLGVGFHLANAWGFATWTPVYLSRHYGLEPGTIGLTLGLLQGIAGVIGFVGGGWLVDRLVASGVKDAHYRYFLVCAVLGGVLGVIAFGVVESLVSMLILWGFIQMLMPILGSAAAHVQSSTPPHYRGRTVALFTLIMNLIGMIAGPSIVPLFSDMLGGPAHIGGGLAIMSVVFAPLATLCFLWGMRPAREALAATRPALAV